MGDMRGYPVAGIVKKLKEYDGGHFQPFTKVKFSTIRISF